MINKQCYFCTSNIKAVDYKDTEVLKRFTNPQSKILPKKRTGTCSLHQRKLARSKTNKPGLDAHKYCGIVKLKESPVQAQKRMRSEWQ